MNDEWRMTEWWIVFLKKSEKLEYFPFIYLEELITQKSQLNMSKPTTAKSLTHNFNPSEH